MTGRDTTGILRIFALSSKSSACSLVGGRKPPKVGDTVCVSVRAPVQPLAAADTAAGAAAVTATREPSQPQRSSPNAVQGRIALQYRTYFYAGSNADITQPSLAVSLRGKIPDSPFRFELQTTLRSTVLGSQNPFASSGINQSRIYRLAVEYDDGSNRVALGRMLAGVMASSGFIDGIAVTRRFGPLAIGGAAGYEPEFSQRTFSADRKKFSLFAGIDPASGSPVSAGLAYTRTYFASALDRDVVSGSIAYAASPDWFFTSQTEVDLHTQAQQQITLKPKLTSLVANASYRPTGALTIGAGVTAWRAVFPLSVTAGIADSLLDRTLWASPNLNVNFSPPGGFSLYESFSPRTSASGFAKEFYNSASVGAWNVFGDGTNVRVSWTTNVTKAARTHGYGASADRRLVEFADLTLRWQYYDFIFTGANERSTSRAFGADLAIRLTRAFTLWSTYELASGFSGNYSHTAVDLTWRF
jgi:hypothetical protein